MIHYDCHRTMSEGRERWEPPTQPAKPYDPRPAGLCINDPLYGKYPMPPRGIKGDEVPSTQRRSVSAISLETFERRDYRSLKQFREDSGYTCGINGALGYCVGTWYVFDRTDDNQPDWTAIERAAERLDRKKANQEAAAK